MRTRSLVLVVVLAGGLAAAPAAGARPCEVRVYFCTDRTCDRAATRLQERRLMARLRADRDVRAVVFVSKAQALAEMKRRYPRLVKGMVFNPLPDSLRIRLRTRERTDAVIARLRPRPPGVELVRAAHCY